MSFLVPKDTSDILQQNRKLPNRNLYLDFNKFIGEWQKKADDNGNLIEFNLGNSKNVIFENIIRSNYHSTDELLQKVTARNVEMIERYKQLKYDTCFLDNLSTQWRLAVGVGSSGPLETGMTLHHLYGFPYIPASSIKGIARACSYLLDENLSKLSFRIFNSYIENIETKKLDLPKQYELLKELLIYDNQFPTKTELEIIIKFRANLEIIRTVFGSQSSVGCITFLDGLPKKFPKLEMDVLTPHYGSYYMNGAFPADNLNPVPSFFLTVAANTPFNFWFYENSSSDKKIKIMEKPVIELVKDWLTGGLKYLGIGGKTSSGYGYFSEENDPINHIDTTLIEQNIEYCLKKDEAFAEIVSIEKNVVNVKILQKNDIVVCSQFRPDSLGLSVGAKIIVLLNIDKKSKKTISCKYIRKNSN